MKINISKDWCMNAAKSEQGQEVSAGASASPCFCLGPQDGEPLCPCKMRYVVIKNGRYVIPEKDLGPAPNDPGTYLED